MRAHRAVDDAYAVLTTGGVAWADVAHHAAVEGTVHQVDADAVHQCKARAAFACAVVAIL